MKKMVEIAKNERWIAVMFFFMIVFEMLVGQTCIYPVSTKHEVHLQPDQAHQTFNSLKDFITPIIRAVILVMSEPPCPPSGLLFRFPCWHDLPLFLT